MNLNGDDLSLFILFVNSHLQPSSQNAGLLVWGNPICLPLKYHKLLAMVNSISSKGSVKVFHPIRWDLFFLGASNLLYLPDVGRGKSGSGKLFGGGKMVVSNSATWGGGRGGHKLCRKKSKTYQVRILYKGGCCSSLPVISCQFLKRYQKSVFDCVWTWPGMKLCT